MNKLECTNLLKTKSLGTLLELKVIHKIQIEKNKEQKSLDKQEINISINEYLIWFKNKSDSSTDLIKKGSHKLVSLNNTSHQPESIHR